MHYKRQIRLGDFKNMKSNSVKLRVRKPNKKRTLKTWVRFCIIRNIFGKSKAEIKEGRRRYLP